MAGRPRKVKYGTWKVPREWSQLARIRTEHLLDKHPLSVQSYQTALANAYLCGIADASEALAQKGRDS